MGPSKFTQLHVYLIGTVLMILVGVGMFFLLIKPANEEIESLNGQVRQKEQQSVQVDNRPFTISQAAAAKKALEEAKERRDRTRAQLNATLARKRLPASMAINFGPAPQPTDGYLISNVIPRWLALPRVLITEMENYAQRSARRHRVTVTTRFSAGAPTTNPRAIPTDIIARTLGPMTVTGRFNDVLAWAEDWNNAPLIVAVDGLRLTLAGDNGVVTGNCTLTVYYFPEGKVTEAAAPAAGGGGGGMYGGMMMGGAMGGMGGGGGGSTSSSTGVITGMPLGGN
jgi:hypothetical protein